MRHRAVITGYGILTGFGFGAEPLRRGLFAGEHAFAPVRRFDAAQYRTRQAAESGFDGDEFAACVACAREALSDANLTEFCGAALLLGTSGDVAALNRFWKARPSDDAAASGRDALLSVPGSMAEAVARALGLEGERLAFTNACVASSSALAYAHEWVSRGREQVVLAGGSSLISEEFFALFDSGRALSRTGCVRPFSRDRDGLLIGDGVAFLVVESEEHAASRGAVVKAELSGWGMSGDGFHVCQPDPQGSGLARAIERALLRAGVRAEAIGYVNAHGTGTPLNDRSEARGLRRVFGERVADVPVSSTKGATGHTFEASGAVEAVISIIALEQGLLPPTTGYLAPDPDCAPLNVLTQATDARGIEYALTVNSAFGGANTALVLRRGTRAGEVTA